MSGAAGTTDRGLAAERTVLARRRTGLSAVGVGALLLHGATTVPAGPAVVLTAAACIAVTLLGAVLLVAASLPRLGRLLGPLCAAALAPAGLACAAAAVLQVTLH